MEWNKALILLAPLMLPDRTIIEDPDFVDIYTKIEGESNENRLYLAMKFRSAKKYHWLMNYMLKLPYFWNIKYPSAETNGNIIFVFETPKRGDLSFDDYKNFGTHSYGVQEWAKVFLFWDGRLKEMPPLWEAYLDTEPCVNKMKKGCKQQPFIFILLP